ncbi:MAG: hypothetical protein IKP67_10160, partial [Spirochaetales bacterium]|nr:hypothetical protein [Spirochaetales bacterium]
MKRILMMTMALIMTLAVIGCPNGNPENDKTQTNTNQSDNKISSLQLLIDKATEGDTIDLSQYTIEGSLSANIDKALTINADGLDFGNAALTVSSDKVELNGIANASVTAAASLGSGSLKISSSSLSSLTIYGGGMHSIYILDVSVDTITIDQSIDSYRDDIVRLVYDASTDFGSIDARSDVFFYCEDQNAAALDASKITVGSNVNVASNTAIVSSDNTSVASVKLTDGSSPSLYVLANSSDTLSEALLNQSIAYITKDSDLALEASNVRIDYTQSVRDGAEYTIAERNEFEFIFDFDGTAENTYILHNKTTGQKTVPTNIKNGQMSPRYITQVSDKDGNIYMTYNSLSLKALIIIAMTYSELCNMEEKGEGVFSYYTIVDTTQDELLPILDKQYIRLAMYEKGATKHLFVLQTQLWDITDDSYYNPNVICLDVTADTANNSIGFKAIGMAELEIKDQWSFGQAISVDADETLYIGINKFTINLNEEDQVYIDFSDSSVNKYYFVP